ncbi:cell division protein [Liquorilactobacillus aquaticus DSM 21051]|uniref:Cell division protein DivIB n=2 Tax=Liquorilactobacillus aquaticus TaxID=392566 RepID=A0A0R2D7P2_9LACO|nr:cell division protein [Liquorilactobacillus aquaticus DSM 21051]
MTEMKKLRRSKLKSQNASPLTPWEKAQQEREKKSKWKKHQFFNKKRIGNKLPDLVRQRRKVLKRHLICNLFVFSLLGLMSLYLVLPASKVQKIEVSGTDTLTKEAVVKAGGVRKGNLLIRTFLNEKEIKSKVKKQVSDIKDIKLVISGTTISYEVSESPIVGYVAKKGKYYSLNSFGNISKIARDEAQGNYPLYYQFKNRNELSSLAKQVARLSPNLRNAMSEIHYTPTDVNEQRIKIYMNDGNEIIATISTFARKMAYYPDIKAKNSNKILVDFEVGAYSYPLN